MPNFWQLFLSPPVMALLLSAGYYAALKFYRYAFSKGRQTMVAETSSKFVRDMAVNHLPHIYDALKRIAESQGVDLPDPPPIRFLPNGDK